MEKRITSRAIIFCDNQIILMYRENNNRVYYTLPGGGLEDNEDLANCVIREIKEELGIDIIPQKEIYYYEDSKSIHHYFTSKWISGCFGTGQGEEYEKDNIGGIYIPQLIDIQKLSDLSLVPQEIKIQLIEDIKNFGTEINHEKIIIKGNY